MPKTDKKSIEKEPDNPIPVRMGDLKGLYRKEAFKLDRSMHWVILQALKEYSKKFEK
jgi:hypothetical protein